MKSRYLIVLIAILAIGAFFAGQSVSQEKKMSDEEAKMMAEWMKYATPDAHHKALEPLVGTWDFKSKYQASPDAPAQESQGTSEIKWILGDRYLQENVTGTMMGGPFNGLSLTGYDLVKKEYFNIWFDDMSTAPMISKGQMDAGGKTMTFLGSYPDVMKNMKDTQYKTVIRLTGPDQHVMEMYMAGDDGKEFKNMEITYTRKKQM